MIEHPFVRKLTFCALAVLAGWIAAFSMAPVSWWPLLFIGLSGLYWLYSRTDKPAQAFAAGFFFAIGYFVTGLWWIGNALLVEGNQFAWVWPISVIGLPTLLGLFTGTYLAIARLISDPKKTGGFMTFVLLLTFSEWTRGHAFTGFPWNLYGYTWADHLPMAQGFFLLGAFGMTFVTVLWASLGGYLLIADRSWKMKSLCMGAAAFSMMVLCVWGQSRLDRNATEFDTSVGVVAVQPNIAQTMKWDPDQVQDNFTKMVSLSRGGFFGDNPPKSIFIVWPETAISPMIYSRTENMDAMYGLLQGYSENAYLVTGILQRYKIGEKASYSNSVAFFDRNMDMLDLYSKFHLVPFGEFIPFQDLIPLTPVAAFNGFTRGEGATTLTHKGLPSFSPLICYEIIFPDDVIPKYGQTRPSWIVNVTNDGWYGNSAGPHQHFAQTRLRAIEEGLPVIRSANTGVSGIIDPYGRVLQEAEINQEATLVSLLPKGVQKLSPFWPWGLQPLLFFASLSCIVIGFFRKARKH